MKLLRLHWKLWKSLEMITMLKILVYIDCWLLGSCFEWFVSAWSVGFKFCVVDVYIYNNRGNVQTMLLLLRRQTKCRGAKKDAQKLLTRLNKIEETMNQPNSLMRNINPKHRKKHNIFRRRITIIIEVANKFALIDAFVHVFCL